MADDDQPSAPPPGPVPAAPPAKPANLKTIRVALARDMLGRGYAPDQVIAWLERPGLMPDGSEKTWTIGRSTARGYVDLALESIDGEVAAPKNRKQARTRAMLTMMFQRAAALALDDRNISRAAQLITAAVAAADKIARIDGAYAYDGSLLLPTGIDPASADDARRIVEHAAATVELARRRGVLAATKPVPPPVIDAEATEVEDDDSGEIAPHPAGDAN